MTDISKIADRLRYLASAINEDKESIYKKFQQNRNEQMETKYLKKFGVIEPVISKASPKDIEAFIDCGERMGVRFI